jgi:hypothetical protein
MGTHRPIGERKASRLEKPVVYHVYVGPQPTRQRTNC